tara:strand:+ start:302 stop:4384 length:4083 start_codon:yes stop_codon:yes gene_type:complete
MSGYTDTIILEANRIQSPEYNNSQDTNLWTNTLSEGIKLGVGDKISVSTAFVSDLGAEDSTIEFKGGVIQSTQKFKVSNIEEISATGDYGIKLKSKPRKLERVNITEKEVILKNIRDNQANFVISYYKTNNGEFMMNLPFHSTPPKDALITDNENPANDWQLNRKNKTYDNCLNSGLPLAISGSHTFAGDYVYDPQKNTKQLIVDNKRFAIFGRPESVYNTNTETEATLNPNAPVCRDLFGTDPNAFYIRMRDLIQIELPVGFNSPSEISNVFTNELSKNTEITTNTVSYEGKHDNIINHDLGAISETPTNKLFNCATFNDLVRNPSAVAFYGNDADGTGFRNEGPLNTGEDLLNYYSAFQYIGIKRPEIFEKGMIIKKKITEPLTPAEYPALTGIVGDPFPHTFLNTPTGNLQGQLLVLDDAGVKSRFPDWCVNPESNEDIWKLENINPCFTDFLSENPFGNWSDDGSTTTINSFLLAISRNINEPEVNYVDFPYVENDANYPLIELQNKQGSILEVKINNTDNINPFLPDDNATVIKVEQIQKDGTNFQRLYVEGTAPRVIAVDQQFGLYKNPTPQPALTLPTSYSVINTNYEWNQENLEMFRDFFEEQNRYPELFNMDVSSNELCYRKNYTGYKSNYNGEDISVDTHRYLHMNSKTNKLMPRELAISNKLAKHPPATGGGNKEIVLTNTEDGYNTDPRSFASQSFGYDNIPSVFTIDKDLPEYPDGSKDPTVITKNIDFSSVPLFVKYFKKYKNNGSGDSAETFQQKSYLSSENFPYRGEAVSGVSQPLGDEIGSKMWGGFALQSWDTVVMRPPIGIGSNKPDWAAVGSTNPNAEDVETIKSYNPNSILKTIGGRVEENVNQGVIPRKTISFVCQVPNEYLETVDIYTRIDANQNYIDDAVPVERAIKTLYEMDIWKDWNLTDPGLPATPIQRLLRTTTRRIGYDSHPSAFGNAFIGLYNGICGPRGHSYAKEYTTAVNKNDDLDMRTATGFTVKTGRSELYSGQYINKVFCGADSPLFTFDTVSSRFSISGLHTSEKITAPYNADLDQITPKVSVEIPPNIGKNCYKINKIMDTRNFCPSITPYFQTISLSITGTETRVNLPYNNPYLANGQIYDMMSGIFLEQFEIEENNWKNSFFGICGFSFEDLNLKNSGNINARITSGNNNNIAKLTTNQNVLNSQLGEWFAPLTGVPNYKNQQTFPVNVHFSDSGTPFQFRQPVQVVGTDSYLGSATIEARDLPTKTLRPYFTVRTNLISDAYFQGGNAPSVYPVIAVVEKNQQYGDFFYGAQGPEFTNTNPRTITSVITQICDPDGTAAGLSPNSCIMYKIVKANNTPLSIIEEVLKANKGNSRIINSIQ